MVSSLYVAEKYTLIDFEEFVTSVALHEIWAVVIGIESLFGSVAQGRAISMLIGAWSDGFHPPRQARWTR